MCYWWFVDASSSIDINRVDYLKRGLVALMFVLGLVLAGGVRRSDPSGVKVNRRKNEVKVSFA